MNLIETTKHLLVAAGATFVLWLLFALSLISVIIAVERFLFFRSRTDDVRSLMAELDGHLQKGAYDTALERLRGMRSVAAAVAAAGLRLAERGPKAADKGMLSAVAAERKTLEARLVFLGTVGNNAPFVGLFGTVIGVILAFEELGQATAASGAASQAASGAVMSAIAEALVATAVGIAVALPAVAAYNFFQRKLAVLLDDAETVSNLVLAYLLSDAPEDAALAAEGE